MHLGILCYSASPKYCLDIPHTIENFKIICTHVFSVCEGALGGQKRWLYSPGAGVTGELSTVGAGTQTLALQKSSTVQPSALSTHFDSFWFYFMQFEICHFPLVFCSAPGVT